jgi:hypothetical protein
MTKRPDRHARAALPIPDRVAPGPTTYDAKDPETAFPPIEPLLPPEGAPNVPVVLLDDVGFGASSAFGGPCQTRRRSGWRLVACGTTTHQFPLEAESPIPTGTHQVRMESAYDGGAWPRATTSACITTAIRSARAESAPPKQRSPPPTRPPTSAMGPEPPSRRTTRPGPLHRPTGAAQYRHGQAVAMRPQPGNVRPLRAVRSESADRLTALDGWLYRWEVGPEAQTRLAPAQGHASPPEMFLRTRSHRTGEPVTVRSYLVCDDRSAAFLDPLARLVMKR